MKTRLAKENSLNFLLFLIERTNKQYQMSKLIMILLYNYANEGDEYGVKDNVEKKNELDEPSSNSGPESFRFTSR